MKYTLDTVIRFRIALEDDCLKRKIQTIRELGFTQEELNKFDEKQVENIIDERYEEWKSEYLYADWVTEEDYSQLIKKG